MRRALAAGLLSLAAAPWALASQPAQPLALELRGVEVYSRDKVIEIIRLVPGQPLTRDPALIAAALETRYHDDGYPAARVTSSYDEGSGTLVLTAEEGHLFDVAFVGLSDQAAESARRAAALVPGSLLTDSDILDAFDRMEAASDGALHGGESHVESSPQGARVVLEPARSRADLSLLLGGDDLHPVNPWTRVDGLSIPLGGKLKLFDLGEYDHLEAYAAGFYATSAEKLRYVAGVSRPFGEGQRLTLGYEHHDLTDSDDTYRSFDLEGERGTAVYLETFSQYFRRNGDEAYVFVRLFKGAALGLSWRGDTYSSLPVVTGSHDPNAPVEPGLMRSIVATARFSLGKALFSDGDSERRSYLDRSLYATREGGGVLRAEATLEKASKSALGGDFDFTRFIANLRGNPRLGSGALDFRALIGLSGESTPVQKLFVLGGVGSVRGYPDRAYLGTRLLQATIEGRVPGRGPWPALLAFYDGGAVSGEAPASGWKSSVGAGLQWPRTGAVFVRADVARPVGDASLSAWRTLIRFQLPI